GYNGNDIPATAALLNNPIDVAVDPAGNLYIADHHNHRIRRVDAATRVITTVAGTGIAGYAGDGGPAILAEMNEPGDVKVDETGAVWFTDFENHRVRRFTVGGAIETVAGSGLRGYARDGGPGPHRRRVTVGGPIETVAGSGLRGYAGDGGPATDARLLFPLGLLVLRSDQVVFT